MNRLTLRLPRWPRLLAALATSACLACAPAQAADAAGTAKTLHWYFLAAETGFDPVKVSDLYSRYVTAHLFEAPYHFDYLARPAKVVPSTATALPEVSDDFKTWTIHIKPGIYFTDDPVFKGKKRELTAQDYAYTYRRHFDPATKSPAYSGFSEEGILGLDELREEALKSRKPFDYDREVPGLRVLDRYTLQFHLKTSRPHFLYLIADPSIGGAMAREVVEGYGEDNSAEHPVGTGPFRLAEWRRSSRIVLERNPNYRDQTYDAQPAPGDAKAQAIYQRFKGRRIPMVDRVEISIIEESQPRWLAFLNREIDLISVPGEFTPEAVPNGKLAPKFARQGVQLSRIVNWDHVYWFFNMEDPVVGGYTPEKVALRRAISLAYDIPREIRLVRRGQAIPAQSIVDPGTYGYDADFKTENSDFDPPRAKALLDLYGYVDRDGDGWREMPDGSPLVIHYATQTSQLDRQFDKELSRAFKTIGVRMAIEPAQWPENLKKARAGQLQMWQLGGTASTPDVQDSFMTLYGPATGGQNLARFKLPAYDKLYDRIMGLPDGPERLALVREAQKLLTAYAPQKYTVHRIVNDLVQPWVVGYVRPAFSLEFWQYLDIDESKRPKGSPK